MTQTPHEKAELEACPFCDSGAHIESLLSGPFVMCNGCGGETRCYRTTAEAIAAWNTRHIPPPLPVDEGVVARIRDYADRIENWSQDLTEQEARQLATDLRGLALLPPAPQHSVEDAELREHLEANPHLDPCAPVNDKADIQIIHKMVQTYADNTQWEAWQRLSFGPFPDLSASSVGGSNPKPEAHLPTREGSEGVIHEWAGKIADIFDHDPDEPICDQGNFGSEETSRAITAHALRQFLSALQPPAQAGGLFAALENMDCHPDNDAEAIARLLAHRKVWLYDDKAYRIAWVEAHWRGFLPEAHRALEVPGQAGGVGELDRAIELKLQGPAFVELAANLPKIRDPSAFAFLPVVIEGPCAVSDWYVLRPDGQRTIISAEDYASLVRPPPADGRS